MRPIDHYGFFDDFPTNEAAPAGGAPLLRDLAQFDLEKIGRLPTDEINPISRHNFAPRGVTAAGIGDAILSLERSPPKDTGAPATVDMYRISYPNRECRAKYTSAKTLDSALMIHRLHLVDRISGAFGIPLPEISSAIDMDGASGGYSPLVGRKRPVGPLGEALSKDLMRMRPLQADSARQPDMVTNYEGEMEGN